MASKRPSGDYNQSGIAAGISKGATRGLTDGDVSGLVEVRENNVRQFQNALDQAIVTALEEVGLVAEGYAKKACPVDTGRLRNSITHAIDADSKSVFIGTNVEYAPCVELGTVHQDAQPFLVPAASGHSDTYRAILSRRLSQ